MSKMIQKNGNSYAVQADAWQVVRPAKAAEGETAPALSLADVPAGAVLVPLAFWQAHKAALVASRPAAELGVWLASSETAETLVEDFAAISLIGVDFPVFRDGRGYSTATLLRTRLGWTGELRAIGDVLFDQLYFMARCGFSQMALRADKNIDDALRAFNEITVPYQADPVLGATEQGVPLFRRRLADAAKQAGAV